MPGETLDDAIAAATTQQAAGIGSLFTLLGENLTSIDEGDAVAAHYHEVLARTKAAGRALQSTMPAAPRLTGPGAAWPGWSRPAPG